MTRILHINTVNTPRNGVAQVMLAIHNSALNFGFESRVLAGYGKSLISSGQETVFGRSRHYFNAFKSRLWSEDGFLKISKFNRIFQRTIESYQPQIVHLHNLHGYYCDINFIDEILRQNDIPSVVTLHDLWLTTGRCAHPDAERNNCRQSCRKCPFPQRYPAKWISGKSHLNDKIKFLSNKTIVTPTVWMADKVSRQNPLVIPHPVDTRIFHPYTNILPESHTLLGISAKWTPDKGTADILRLAEMLPDGWKIKIIGKGKQPRHPKIIHLGFINEPTAIAHAMAGATALISASRHESFGLTVAEALAVGTPVIVRQNTAPADFISAHGFSVDFSCPEKIIEKLPLLCGLKRDSVYHGVNAVEEYYSLYEQILSESRE